MLARHLFVRLGFLHPVSELHVAISKYSTRPMLTEPTKTTEENSNQLNSSASVWIFPKNNHIALFQNKKRMGQIGNGSFHQTKKARSNRQNPYARASTILTRTSKTYPYLGIIIQTIIPTMRRIIIFRSMQQRCSCCHTSGKPIITCRCQQLNLSMSISQIYCNLLIWILNKTRGIFLTFHRFYTTILNAAKGEMQQLQGRNFM